MKLELIRTMCGATCTIGDLYVDGVRQCYTLEDVVRPDGEKVYGETAIPYGRYRVRITFSNRFQRDLPLLLDVPNFDGIRIHPGNTAADTHGCLLVGMDKSGDTITNSRVAFAGVFADIRDAIERGEEVWVEIKDAL
jgi:Family of unknown function (DUF5675)